MKGNYASQQVGTKTIKIVFVQTEGSHCQHIQIPIDATGFTRQLKLLKAFNLVELPGGPPRVFQGPGKHSGRQHRLSYPSEPLNAVFAAPAEFEQNQQT